MVGCRSRLIVALLLFACSDDAPVDDASTSAGDDAPDDDGPGPGSQPDTSISSDGSSTSDTTAPGDTTCGTDCATTTDATTTTTTDPGSTTTSEGPQDSESSSSEGPMGVCGDGMVEGDEECDEAVETATCDDDCTFADCGDEIVNEAAGEVCDEGGESFSCDSDCTLPVCGDGITNESHDEVCDGGGPTSTCDDDCTLPLCGDGNQNLAALESCDDGNNLSDDGCSGTCVLEGDFGGYCRVVDGRQWCFNDDACGQACEDVCETLGLTIEPNDAAWFAAQDSLAECQEISDAFGLNMPVNFGDDPLACLEDAGLNDLVGGGLTGGLSCSSDPSCPAAHRTDMNDLGLNCNLVGARRSVCPCAGEFCGNGIVEGVEICDDGNEINNDGCTTACSDVQALEFTRSFTQFVASTPEDCEAWTDFRSTIANDHTLVSITGTSDPVGRTCTGDEARQICDALRDGSPFFSIACDGNTWFVDNCSGIELTADNASCACMLDEMNPGYSIRPCINHQDWGGVGTISCGAPTQTITVSCGY